MSAPIRAVPTPGEPPDRVLVDEVLRGLTASRKTLPPKLFYDDAGARLFEKICELDEYYLTRSELEILRAHAHDIAARAGEGAALVEYGSGAGIKIRLLLDALRHPSAYVPIDISGEQLARVSGQLATEYPDVAIRPVCADYSTRFRLPPLDGAKRVAFFPGSTIGNFHPAEAAAFLRRVRDIVGRDGALVLGVDRVKDARVIEAAYNDAHGVTAAFDLNVLVRLNRDLGADFDLASFRHRAVFNADASRIEMHLESLRAQTVHLAGRAIAFAAGETIWTESSYKYSYAQLRNLAESAGFAIDALWSDRQERFWVAYVR